MKTHFLNSLVAALIIAAGSSANPLRVNAQQNSTSRHVEKSSERALPRYNLEIANGLLLLENLRDRIDVKEIFGAVFKVPATLSNLVTVLRELHTNANIVMEPSLAKIKIAGLKIRSTYDSDDSQLKEELLALAVASGYKFRWEQPRSSSEIDPLTGQPVKTETSLSLYVLSPDSTAGAAAPRRIVEVFNVAGYLKGDPKEIDNKLHIITAIVTSTVRQIKGDDFSPEDEDEVKFQFHSGANLLIATGPQESIEVARKVVNALSGRASVDIESRSVLVMGAVSKPGSITLPETKITIIDAIGLAGGTTRLANEKKIEFTHKGKTEVLSFDQLEKINNQNEIIYLEPGDIIKVPELFL